jgi:tRNA nucleotidyltransferase/poly(A) polymerase
MFKQYYTMPKIYLVGGAVRDLIRGTKSKDLDYVIETSNYDEARDMIVALGCKIVQERPEYKVFRCVHPDKGGIDFALPRADINCDGRHADTLTVDSLLEDLSRRDFTMNAIAIEVDSELNLTDNIIDPFNGRKDIEDEIIRFVGNPEERIDEDNLRVLRALRFAVTLGFSFSGDTRDAIMGTFINKSVSNERIFEELNKMFRVSNSNTIKLLSNTYQLYLLDRIKLTAST